jgi:uncharacterized damage-inducible protein DinB/predicted RNase H-like HicB family nuclease
LQELVRYYLEPFNSHNFQCSKLFGALGEKRVRVFLAVEDMEPNHWIAWAQNLPACYSSATTAADAVALAPQKITKYFSWLLDHNSLLPAVNEPIEVEVVETFHSYSSSEDPEYFVNAFFDDDRRPLGYWDVEIGLQLLNWTRQDLLDAVQSIAQEQLIMSISGEKRGSISGILHHMAIAENWYFSQLECGLEQAQLPCEPLENLVEVRRNIRKQLTGLIGDDRITRNCEELWSARKVLRRTLWHERDHTQQIIQLLTHL